MSIYDRYGVTPIVNMAGPSTRYGGALVSPAVIHAMSEAAKYSVAMDELQAAASRLISRLTYAEAGIVTNGASASLTLGIAACLAGLDVARMNRLPDTRHMPHEVIMPWHQISGYDHAIRLAGAELVGVGIPNDTSPPLETYIVRRSDVASAVTPQTAALAYATRKGAHPSLEEMVSVAREFGVPLVIDASMEVPPVTNLRRFIELGADLICVSGGKGICGPQNSGLLYGRHELVASALIQMLDMAGATYDDWTPPLGVSKHLLTGKPQHGIGRGMKVSKEAIIGLLTALEEMTSESVAKRMYDLEALLKEIADSISPLPGIQTRIEPGVSDYPTLYLQIDESQSHISAQDVVSYLESCRPAIYIENEERYLSKGCIVMNSINLDGAVAQYAAKHLRSALIGSDTRISPAFPGTSAEEFTER